jgi:hypothetical protein
MHVRQSSTIKRVKGILDALGAEFEVVALDVFLRMAASEPTFDYPHYLSPDHRAPPGRRPTSTGRPDAAQ